jgi:hypothetical protein
MNDETRVSYSKPELWAMLAEAWESGYWNGTSHEGPLTDAAVSAKNPYKKESK